MPKKSACLPIISLAASIVLAASVAALAQSGLPRSKVCIAEDGGWSSPGAVPATGHITMSNDGGWCGQRLGIENNSLVFGGAMHLTQQPEHGQVSITVHDDGTDVYYKPNAGYKGPDRFKILIEFFNIDKPYDVTVQ